MPGEQVPCSPPEVTSCCVSLRRFKPQRPLISCGTLTSDLTSPNQCSPRQAGHSICFVDRLGGPDELAVYVGTPGHTFPTFYHL